MKSLRTFRVLILSKPVSRVTSISARSFSFFKHVEMGPKDPILGVAENFAADKFPGKINVGVGAYRDDDGKPWVLPSVREAEKRILASNANHEYPPISGVPEFVKEARDLAYGATSPAVTQKRVAAAQSLSGTGALRLAGEFIATQKPGGVKPKVLVPNPTWSNHFSVFQRSGLETATYRYWDAKTLGLDMTGLLADIRAQPKGSVVLLHSCAHNPTGVDPNMEQWAQISAVCKEMNNFVLFDNAYQGFASGNTDTDIRSVKLFIDQGHNIGLCQSFAKNFGLYGQRAGLFSVLCADADEAARVDSQIKIIARAIYSNPPLHGARIVATVLGDPVLKAQWQSEIATMASRIIGMRKLLKSKLAEKGSKLNWDHITNQIGMFSYTGVTPEQCDRLTNEFHIYLTRNGRISMAGVTTKNVDKIAEAFHAVTKA